VRGIGGLRRESAHRQGAAAPADDGARARARSGRGPEASATAPSAGQATPTTQPSSTQPSSAQPSPTQAATAQDTGNAAPDNAPETDPRRFTGISDTDATRLLGPPAEKKDTPPSRVWTYRSATCDFKLFFYPEVGGNGYRALTSQFGNPNMTESEKRACVASLLKVHAG
jgi:hypothetical protein